MPGALGHPEDASPHGVERLCARVFFQVLGQIRVGAQQLYDGGSHGDPRVSTRGDAGLTRQPASAASAMQPTASSASTRFTAVPAATAITARSTPVTASAAP